MRQGATANGAGLARGAILPERTMLGRQYGTGPWERPRR